MNVCLRNLNVRYFKELLDNLFSFKALFDKILFKTALECSVS